MCTISQTRIVVLLQLDQSTALDQINNVLDDLRYTSILNSSGWPTTKYINTTTNADFLQYLIHNVVHNWLKSVQSFCQGLEHLEVVTLLKQNPDLMKPVFFCQCHQILTSDVFLSLANPINEERMVIYDWFVEYVKSKSREATLEKLFVWHWIKKRIAPMGLKDCITTKFLSNVPLSMAEACSTTNSSPWLKNIF